MCVAALDRSAIALRLTTDYELYCWPVIDSSSPKIHQAKVCRAALGGLSAAITPASITRPSFGAPSVLPLLKLQHRLLAGRIDLVHYTWETATNVVSFPINITCPVQDQA